MPVPARVTAGALHQRDELVADVDEGGTRPATAERHVEEAAPELDRRVDVADVECDVVDPDQARARHLVERYRRACPRRRRPWRRGHGHRQVWARVYKSGP